jgi:ubiquinone/menaquinone biosynthesis C-methylase UbiE
MNQEIVDFYNAGAEIGRLERGIGKIEFERTKELILRVLPKEQQRIYDIGGGIGVYSRWLASLGHEVHLMDLAPEQIAYAQKINQESDDSKLVSMEVADAREVNKKDESADVVLLMGPMYHLLTVEDRTKALKEAYRVLKKDGLLICTGITRYGNLLWSLSVYGTRNKILDEVDFFNMVQEEIETGHHGRPEKYPYFIARSYFHYPEELEEEIRNGGFHIHQTLGVEGPTWMAPLDVEWKNTNSRETLLNAARLVEADLHIMAMSPHLLTIASKA